MKINSMMKQYSVLICILVSSVLLVIASLLYPGGSLLDKNSAGFDWSKNFISNLFLAKALNGEQNPARFWAIIGMAIHSIGYGIFYIHMSKKIPAKHAAGVLQFIGATNVLFTFLIVTPLHDIMVTISATLTLLGLFYITVYLFKTKLHWLKAFSISCLLIFYYTLFLYGLGNWGLLAVMQKVSFISSMLLVLALEYFATAEDFKTVLKPQNVQTSNS